MRLGWWFLKNEFFVVMSYLSICVLSYYFGTKHGKLSPYKISLNIVILVVVLALFKLDVYHLNAIKAICGNLDQQVVIATSLLDSGTADDKTMALHLLKRAAGKNNKYALMVLGDYYYKNRTNEQNAIAAFECHNKLMNVFGLEDAKLIVACLYKDGIGTRKDISASMNILNALSTKNSEAAITLGELYINSDQMGGNQKRAVELFHSAYLLDNNPYAALYIGIVNERGIGVERDITKANLYYKIFNETTFDKNKLNAVRFASVYQNGYGRKVDLVEAYKYYYISSIEGNHYAKMELKALSQEMSLLDIEEAKRRAVIN